MACIIIIKSSVQLILLKCRCGIIIGSFSFVQVWFSLSPMLSDFFVSLNIIDRVVFFMIFKVTSTSSPPRLILLVQTYRDLLQYKNATLNRLIIANKEPFFTITELVVKLHWNFVTEDRHIKGEKRIEM